MTAGAAERIGNCTQLSRGLGGGVGAGFGAEAGVEEMAGVAFGVAWVVGVTFAASDGAGAGVRGRGGNRIQLSISVTGPWA